MPQKAEEKRLADVDPWEAVAAARLERGRVVAGWALRAPRGRALAMVPLAAAYFLSYLLRNVNGVVAADLMRDLGIGAGALGLLTSVYFLVFASAQLPIGTLLDRWGPRRVQSTLLACAGVGACLCALNAGLPVLFAGRALVGLGTAGALVGGLKAAAEWFPGERLPLVNGLFIMNGGLGAFAASWPAAYVLRWVDWHGLFLGLGIALFAVAGCVCALVPRGRVAAPAAVDAVRLADVLRDPFFRRFAPLSASCFGAVLALQGLWAGPFLSDVARLSRPEVALDLALMAVVLIVAAPLWGVLTSRVGRRVPLPRVAAAAAAVLMVAEASVLLPSRWPAVGWCGIAVFGGMTVLSYSVLAERFPPASLGRANAALNVLHIGTAFVIQLGVGQIVALWPLVGGHYPRAAYQCGLLLPVLVQVLALSWFVLSDASVGNATTSRAAARG